MSHAGFCSRRDNDEDNSYHVVLFKEPGMTAVLDGFTIKGGMADFPENDIPGECNHESDDDDDWNYPCEDDEDCAEGSTCDVRRNVRGAGIEIHQFGKGVCDEAHHIACDGMTPCPSGAGDCDFAEEHMESRVTVRNCTIKENSAVNHGGGVDDHGSDSVFENCRFINNYAGRQGGSPATAATDGRGGAFYTAHGSPVIDGCDFEYNGAGTITAHGGAFYADHDSSSTVRDCVFLKNEATEGGGAMWVESEGGGFTVADTDFIRNLTNGSGGDDTGGGAIYVSNIGPSSQSHGTIEECRFIANISNHYGGAVWVDNPAADFLVRDSIFAGNEGVAGGAIYIADGRLNPAPHLVVRNDFVGNEALDNEATGGAIGMNSGTVDVHQSKFVGNSAGRGGAVGNAEVAGAESLHEVTLVDSLFIGNISTLYGGAMANWNVNAAAYVNNCTVADNEAPENSGGGFYLAHGAGTSVLDIRNSILWGNSEDGVVSELAQARSSSSVLPDIEYSIVEGCSTGSGGYCFDSGDENLDTGSDPLFPDPTTGTWEDDNSGSDDAVSYEVDLHQTTFTDYSASFGSLAGLVFKPNHTDHADVYTLIVSNTSTTITVWGDFSSGYLVNGKTYQIRDYRLDECSPAIDSGNDDEGYLARDVWDLDGDTVKEMEAVPYDLAGNAREYNDTGVSDTGSDTGGNVSSAINDRGAYERQTNSSECE